MESHLLEWLELAVRWIHIIAGIAWIGASFYFNWLDGNLRPLNPDRKELAGSLWAIHGGGFYQVEKYKVAPAFLPRTLHWFKWEAYLTWISGFGLLVLIYYLGAEAYLIDKKVADIPPFVGVGIGLATLALTWGGYHFLCKTGLARHPFLLAIVGFALAVFFAHGLTRVFTPRAAYIHVGAMLGTVMAANVFFVIIPNQRATVRAMLEGREPDPQKGREAKLRSLHNNYITLPVLFIMISSHFPSTYGHKWNWIVLAGLAIVGGVTRHFFNLKNQGRRVVWLLPVAAGGLIALAIFTLPASSVGQEKGAPVRFGEARAVLNRHCLGCHSAYPTNPAYPQAPNGVVFDTPEEIKNMSARIKARAVDAETMPLGNPTGMTKEERVLLGRWIAEGARLK